MTGLTFGMNALDFMTVRCHYSADPAKSPEWAEKERRRYPDPSKWEQEMEINWFVAAGKRVFPQFSETLHGRPLEHRARKVIYRAWDFGWLTPACVLAQIDPKDRLIVLREIVGREETTKAFAQRVIARCAEWYPMRSAGYEDFCDPAGQQASSTASEHSEVRDVEVLNGLGIYPRWQYGWSRKDGRSLIHQLLAVRVDDTPSCYVDGAQCPTLLQAFLGKYVYPPKRGGQSHDEPDETNHPWSDVMACLRYMATGLYSALGLRRGSGLMPAAPEPEYHGYGSPIRR